MYYKGAIACSSSVWMWQWSSALHIPGTKNFVTVIRGGSSSPVKGKKIKWRSLIKTVIFVFNQHFKNNAKKTY